MRVWLLALWLATGAATGAAARRGGDRHGDSHSYPHSTGYSGTGSGGSHTYPHSNTLSGDTHDYNNRKQTYQQNAPRHVYTHKTEVHHHYHYSPPQQISYGAAHHPVYHGPPPVYVYEYRDSGSRFDNLLTGLALYNLGRMSANSHHNNHDFHSEYSGSPGEICKLGISKQTGEYEETRIDCKLMSSFIWEASTPQNTQRAVSSSSVTTTQTNVTHSVNAAGDNSSVTTVVVKNVTVTDALKAKGPSIEVTPGMTCYMIRISRDTSTLKKNVECGLLQEYARRSLRRNNSERLKPVLAILINFILYNCLHNLY